MTIESIATEPDQSIASFTDFFFSQLTNSGCILALIFTSLVLQIWFLNYITAQSTELAPHMPRESIVI